MTPVQRPLGFTLLALYLTLSVVSTVFEGAPGDASLQGMAALPLVTAVFAAVAAEALWRCRQWCVRAFVAYCCLRLLGPLAGVIGIGTLQASEPLVGLAMGGFVAAIVGGYVHNRAAQLFASSAGRVPIPAPRP